MTKSFGPERHTIVGHPVTRGQTPAPTREDLEREIAMLRANLASEQRQAARILADLMTSYQTSDVLRERITELSLENGNMRERHIRDRQAVQHMAGRLVDVLADLCDADRLAEAFDRAARTISGRTAAQLVADLAAPPPATDDPFGPVVDTAVGFASGTAPTDRFDDDTVVADEGMGR